MRLLSAYSMYRSASDSDGYDTMSFNNDVVDYHYLLFL